MYSRFLGRARKDSRGEREASAAEERNSADCIDGLCGRPAAQDTRGQAHLRTWALGCHAAKPLGGQAGHMGQCESVPLSGSQARSQFPFPGQGPKLSVLLKLRAAVDALIEAASQGGFSRLGLAAALPGASSRQVWQGRWGALTSAPRPAPPGKISAPRPAPPSAPGLAWASPSPVDPLTYFAQG